MTKLEELVLVAAFVMKGEGYGASISKRINKYTSFKATPGAVHTVINKLEERGWVRTDLSPVVHERGGRRRTLCTITKAGQKALEKSLMDAENLFKS